ncbi:MAG: InlB B-repeat-containing protein [Clostridia bacterium]|nr:InlB B-repeat-containing protein [Clostridia bacterium]MDY6184033.1 InlB B-repeat-containing protein [Eubacteriales bacterium]
MHTHTKRVSLALVALLLAVAAFVLVGCGKKSVYTVTFDADGGSAVEAQSIEAGGVAVTPEAPTKEGSTFAGWYLGEAPYDFATPVVGDITLKAHWDTVRVTVTFDAAGGSTVAPQTVDWNTAAILPAAPEKEGYDFAGWYLGDTAYDFSTPVKADLTLTAKWTVKTSTVTFDTAGGSTVTPQTVEWNATATLPDEPSKEGYDFIGWYLGGTAYDFSTPVKSNITLVAHWQVKTFTVTFLDDAGNTLKTETVAWGQSATAPVPPEKGEEYVFARWDTDYSCVKSPLTVTAQYGRKLAVTFLDEDDTQIGEIVYAAEGYPLSRPQDPTKEGYDFARWCLTDGTPYDFTANVTAPLTLKASWTIKTFTVTFDTAGGSAVASQTVDWNAVATLPDAPTKEGYDFAGWYLGDAIYEFTTPVKGALTLTAKWNIKTYRVTFLDEDGETELATATVDWNTTVAMPKVEKEGYYIYRWTLNGETYDFSTPVTSVLTLVAQWVSTTDIPAATTDTLMLSPWELEVWQGVPLQLAVCGTANAAGDYAFISTEVEFDFVTMNPNVATVASDGTVTPVAIGTTYVYAIVKVGGSGAVITGSKTQEEVTLNAGEILQAVEVRVIDKPDYIKKYEADPENQQITLGTSKVNASDFLSYPTGAYGSANISAWYGGTSTVFTMTADDNLMADFSAWASGYEQYGVPVTLCVPTSTYFETGVTWREMVEKGLMVQSHSHYHRGSWVYSAGHLTSAQDWMDFYLGQKEINLAGAYPSIIVAYPCGYNNKEISPLLYIAGRSTYGAVNRLGNINYNSIASYSGIAQSTDAFGAIFAAADGTWYSTHYHSINSSLTNLTPYYEVLSTYIDAGTLWATDFVKAAQYGQERDTATLNVLSADSDTIRLTVTDKMHDDLFFQPLTVRIKVDGTWTGARAMQNGVERAAKVVTVNGETYLLVDAVPDQGEVTVVRTSTENLAQTENRISFTPTDALGTYADLPYTLRFEVDGTTWGAAYATQGGNKLTAKMITERGKTYVEVTCYAGGGEVVIVPVTNQFDDRTEYTMTEVYGGEVLPTAEKKITISTPEELRMFAAYVNAGNTCENLTFVLADDIDMTGEDFTPIGWELIYEKSSANYYYHPFSGTFDGQGHTISHLTAHSEICNSGLFAYTKNATIKNLHLTDADISGIKRVGGIVGRMDGGLIDNCTFTGKVVNRGVAYGKNSGSYTGSLIGQLHCGTLQNCSAEADVIAYAGKLASEKGIYDNSSNTFNSGCYVGGAVGHTLYSQKESAGLGKAAIRNVSFVGTVTAHMEDGSGAECVGGFLGGGMLAEILNCSSTATVTGNRKVGGFVGDLVGDSQVITVKNCVANGTVTGNDSVGGFAGRMAFNKRAVIENCFANVKVNAPEGATYVGSVIGMAQTGAQTLAVSKMYYIPSLNEGMATHVANIGSAALSITITEVASVSEAKALLNANASALDGAYEWMNAGDTLSPVHYPIWDVTFVDKDGNTLKTMQAANGTSVDASEYPDAPAYLGFRFLGWSVPTLTAVSGNVRVEALYEAVDICTITFYEKDGTTVLETVQVNAGETVTPPTPPELLGFKFIGWTGVEIDPVTESGSVVATYETIATYTVTFYERDGVTVIATQTVNQGANATPPIAPTVEGYLFTGWNGSYENVTEDTSVVAEYVKVYTVVFYDTDGSVLSTQRVPAGTAAEAPTNVTVPAGQRCKGWDTAFDAVQADLEVRPVLVEISPDPISVNTRYVSLETKYGKTGVADAIIKDNPDLVFYSGISNLTPSEAQAAAWASIDEICVRGSTAGGAIGIMYSLSKFEADTRYRPMVIVPYDSTKLTDKTDRVISESAKIGTDTQLIAMPLIDKTTNKTVVVSFIYMGSNTKNDAASIQKYMNTMCGELVKKYTNVDEFMFAIRVTKGGNSGLTGAFSAIDDTTAYIEGWDFNCFAEYTITANSTSLYYASLSPDGETSSVTTEIAAYTSEHKAVYAAADGVLQVGKKEET